MKFTILLYTIIKILLMNFYVNCEVSEMNEGSKLVSETVIDPHSIYFQRYKNKETEQPYSHNIKEESCYKKMSHLVQHCGNQETCMQYKVYYKRLINMLLLNTAIKYEGNFVEGKLHIQASKEQINILQSFESNKLSLQEVDLILSEIIKKPEYNVLEEATYFTEQLFRFMKEYKEAIFPSIMILLLLTIFRNITWSKYMIIVFILSAMFLTSFILTYWQLLQEAEAKLAAKQIKFTEIPSACFPSEMSILEKISSFLYTNNDCEEYHKAVMTNSKLQVTPVQVLSRLFSTVIFEPLGIIGHAVSEFVEKATANLSGPLRWLVICLLFLAVCFLVVILPFCLFGSKFSISLGPLFRFSLNDGRSSTNDHFLENVKKVERVERIKEVSDNGLVTRKTAMAHTHDYDNCITIKLVALSNAIHNESNKPESTDLCEMDEGSGDARTRKKEEQKKGGNRKKERRKFVNIDKIKVNET